MFRDPFGDPFWTSFAVFFLQNFVPEGMLKRYDVSGLQMRSRARFEELTWLTSAERCVGTYSVVALSNVKKASRPCLARCYLVIISQNE